MRYVCPLKVACLAPASGGCLSNLEGRRRPDSYIGQNARRRVSLTPVERVRRQEALRHDA